MSLDLMILDDENKPLKTLSFSQTAHHKLVFLAKKYRLTEISLLEDYYGDVVFDIESLSILRSEIQFLQSQKLANEFVSLLNNFLSLVDTAQRHTKKIEAVAD